MLAAVALTNIWLLWGEKNYKQYMMFKNARESGDVSQYEEYYNYYSQGRFADIMRDSVVSYYSRVNSIQEIYKAACRNQYDSVGTRLKDMVAARADKEYSQAMMSGSIVELERFVNDCPAKYQKDARTILEKRAWADDTVAWETAQRRNTKEAYQTYLDLYCDNGTHTKEAIDGLTRKLKQGSTNTMGDLEKIGGGGSHSSVRITNSTHYRMKVFFSGQDSKYLILDCYKSGTVRLINGHYDVVVTIDDPETYPCSGEYDLTGGSYYTDLGVSYSLSHFPLFRPHYL